jgi:hypothetical protein
MASLSPIPTAASTSISTQTLNQTVWHGQPLVQMMLFLRLIDFNYKESRRRDEYGNSFKYRAKVYDARKANVGRWAWDVFLVSTS